MEYSEVLPIDRTVDIIGPDGDSTGIKIVVCSINDERMKRLRRRIQDKRLSQDAKGRALKGDELNENRNEVAFAAIQSWDWGKDKDGKPNTFNGKPPELTRKNAFDVFEKLYWIRDQVEEAISDEKSFFKVSALT